MTKALKTLVRIREMELDRLRREVAVLYDDIDKIEGKQQSLAQQLINEQVYLTRMEGITSYALFARSAREWQAELDQEKAAVESKVYAKTMQISTAYEALKTAQIALNNALAAARNKIVKSEQDALDEAALMRFSRQSQTP